MKILDGCRASNLNEATALVLRAESAKDMDVDVIDMFVSLVEEDKINIESDKTLGAAVRSRYGSRATWQDDRWFVPVPEPRYEVKDGPVLAIDVKIFVVFAARVSTSQGTRLVTTIGIAGKPVTLSLPMPFLWSLIEDNLGRFAVIGRDAVYTTWEVPGLRPVRLPTNFVESLYDWLWWESVVGWLQRFGEHGRRLAPLVAGSLLGLAFPDPDKKAPAGEGKWDTADLLGALESLAFPKAEAKVMVNRVSHRLSEACTLEEAIRLALKGEKGGTTT